MLKAKPCAICGDLFTPLKPSNTICPKDHTVSCPICGSTVVWNTTRKIEPCSKPCRKELTRRNNLAKYGVEHPMQSKEVQQHHRQAMLDKYGVESPLQSEAIRSKAIATNQAKFGADWKMGTPEFIAQAKETNLERYGSENVLASEAIKQKSLQSMLDRYGVANPSQSPEIRKKMVETNLEKYGCANPASNPDVRAKISATRTQRMDEIIENMKKGYIEKYGVDNPSKCPEVIDRITATFIQRYGVKRAIHVPEFRDKMQRTCEERYGAPLYVLSDKYSAENGHIRISKLNKDMASDIVSSGLNVTMEFRIGSKRYDIAVDGTNIVLEIDPTYTHNLIGSHFGPGLPDDYHLVKSQIASDNGYRCIHVFDWDDKTKIINMLSPKQKVYARRCKVYKLKKEVARDFLNAHHLQGSVNGQLLCLGLVYEGELMQVMTFGRPRYDKKYTAELLRLCTKSGYIVVGGAERLFKFATNYFCLDNIISYCDLSKFTGQVYERLGMKRIRNTPPQIVWSRGNNKITSNLLRARGYDQLFGTSYGKGTSNEQLMIENGWLPICDCGQAVFEYVKD